MGKCYFKGCKEKATEKFYRHSNDKSKEHLKEICKKHKGEEDE